MPHLLQNKNIALVIDLPNENYKFSRFDWTGKITSLRYKGIAISGNELINPHEDKNSGIGFCNEFGIDTPVGYKDIKTQDWFHKIGVGLLQKNDTDYHFLSPYNIEAAQFGVNINHERINIDCKSAHHNGYAYILEKEIQLLTNGFVIHYLLKNTGKKPIITNEYNHNFITIDNEKIDKTYQLKFPFLIKPELFSETVNPNNCVKINAENINFESQPKSDFFFSNLSGDTLVDAQWCLENTKTNIGIREVGNFKTKAINLWGCGHVISPELFININLEPNATMQWSREYLVYELS